MDDRVRTSHSYMFKWTDRTQILKPILHALLIPETLTFLSVASNRRLKAPAFRLIGAFMIKACNARGTNLAWANLFVVQSAPVSRSFAKLAG